MAARRRWVPCRQPSATRSFDLYIQPLDGPPTLIYAQDEPGYLAGVTVSPSGRDAVAVRTASSFSGQLLRIDLETGSVIDLRPMQTQHATTRRIMPPTVAMFIS